MDGRVESRFNGGWIRRRRTWSRIVVAAVLGLVVMATASGTASGGAGRDDAAARSAVKIPKLPMNAALHKKLPASNLKSGKLIFDTVPNPPWAIVGTDGKVESGVDVDLGRALTQVLGLKLSTVLVGDASTLLAGISAGRYDTFLGPLGLTPARLQTLDEIVWVYNTFYFLVQHTSSIHTVTGLCGKNVAVLKGTISETVVSQVSQVDCVAQSLPAISEVEFATAPEGVLAVRSGRATAYAEADGACRYGLRQPGGDAFACIVPGPADQVAINPAALAVANTNVKLVNALFGALKVLKKSGVYQKILAKWNLENDAVKRFSLHKAPS